MSKPAADAYRKLPSLFKRSKKNRHRQRSRRRTLERLELRAMLAGHCTTVVVNTDDSGAGSLRDAIECSNSEPDVQTISFNIPGAGPHVIQPASGLPFITDPAIIDGFTQPGATPNTNPITQPINATPQIVLDGTSLRFAAGLRIEAGDTTVQGLVIGGFNLGIQVVSDGNTVRGSFLGTQADGITPNPNGSDINAAILVVLSSNNVIGGTNPADRNLISGNRGSAIEIATTGGGDGNIVQGNFIGTTISGADALPNNTVAGTFITSDEAAVSVSTEASNTLIGGTTESARNVIAGNQGVGLTVFGAVTVQGNYIGVSADGSTAVPNNLGVFSRGAVIGGAAANEGNVVSGNTAQGINTDRSVVQGNRVGTNPAGTAAIANGIGIVALSTNQIGGTTPGAGNLVSGNMNEGFVITGRARVEMTENVVEGNLIGTNAEGTAALGNGSHGILLVGERNNANTIGGDTPAARNLISGNGGSGIEIRENSVATSVLGNFIGTDVTGNVALGNGEYGVAIYNAQDNLIGGATSTPGTGGGNVISGNVESGVDIDSGNVATGDPSTGNLVRGNIVGLGVDGVTNVSNGEEGVAIINAANNVVGGPAADDGNLISGNALQGVLIASQDVGVAADIGALSNSVQNNWIGTDITGTLDRGNGSAGVTIIDSVGNAIHENVIAFNSASGASTGIEVQSGTGNVFLQNSIFSNPGLGIDLQSDGVTANDVDDADVGANNLQNYPLLTSATEISGETVIEGSLNSLADQTYRVEFFSSPTADPSGFGEGQTFLGFQNVVTDASGNATIDFASTTVVPNGQFVTATATLATSGAATAFVETSEFSGVIEAQASATGTAPVATDFPLPVIPLGTTFSVDATDIISDFGTDADSVLTSMSVSFGTVEVNGANVGGLDDVGFTYTPGAGPSGALTIDTAANAFAGLAAGQTADVVINFTVTDGNQEDVGELTYTVSGDAAEFDEADVHILGATVAGQQVAAQSMAEADESLLDISVTGASDVSDLLSLIDFSQQPTATSAVLTNAMLTVAVASAANESSAAAAAADGSVALAIAMDDSVASASAQSNSDANVTSTNNSAASAAATSESSAQASADDGAAADADALNNSTVIATATAGSAASGTAQSDSSASAIADNQSSATAFSQTRSTSTANANGQSIANARAIEDSTATADTDGGSDAAAEAGFGSTANANATDASSASAAAHVASTSTALAEIRSTTIAMAANQSEATTESQTDSVAIGLAIENTTMVMATATNGSAARAAGVFESEANAMATVGSAADAAANAMTSSGNSQGADTGNQIADAVQNKISAITDEATVAKAIVADLILQSGNSNQALADAINSLIGRDASDPSLPASEATATAENDSISVSTATDQSVSSATARDRSSATAFAGEASASNADATTNSTSNAVAVSSSAASSIVSDVSEGLAFARSGSAAESTSQQMSSASASAEDRSNATATAQSGSTATANASDSASATSNADDASVSNAEAMGDSVSTAVSVTDSAASATAANGLTAFASAKEQSAADANASSDSVDAITIRSSGLQDISTTTPTTSLSGLAGSTIAVPFVFEAATGAIESVVISGLPPGSVLSEGTSNVDGTEWTFTALPSAGLTLVTPASFVGEFAALVTLNNGSDEIASASQRVVVTGDAATDPVISIADAEIVEGNEGQSNLVLTLTRDANTGTLSIPFSTSDGTAKAGEDYAATSGTVEFAAGGSMTQTISIPVFGDRTVEPDETFTVQLDDVSGVEIPDGQAVATILNDDAPSTDGCLTSGPLVVGDNELTYACAAPGGFVAFVYGTQPGKTVISDYGVTVDIAQPSAEAIGIGNIAGQARVIVNLSPQQLQDNLLIQAFEVVPNGSVSNVLTFQSSLDVSGEGEVTAFDALLVINELLRRNTTAAGESYAKEATLDLDANRDGNVTPLDALAIINRLNLGNSEAERPQRLAFSQATFVDDVADDLNDDLLRILAQEQLRRF